MLGVPPARIHIAGGLDEVRVYDRAVAASEVSSMFWSTTRHYVHPWFETNVTANEETGHFLTRDEVRRFLAALPRQGVAGTVDLG